MNLQSYTIKMEEKGQERSGWGGKRKGSGRPAIPNKVVKVIKMPKDQADKVHRYAAKTGLGSFSAVIRRIVEELPEISDEKE